MGDAKRVVRISWFEATILIVIAGALAGAGIGVAISRTGAVAGVGAIAGEIAVACAWLLFVLSCVRRERRKAHD